MYILQSTIKTQKPTTINNYIMHMPSDGKRRLGYLATFTCRDAIMYASRLVTTNSALAKWKTYGTVWHCLNVQQ